MQRSYLILIAFFLTLTQASLSFASGGYSGGSGGGFNSGYNDSRKVRQIDQNYEVGKAIFNGRQAGEPSLQYCVLDGDAKVPVKRKSVKAYKNATYDDFSNNLFQCDQPDKLIAQGLTRDSLIYVLYYLNKRHKLELKGS